MEQVRGHHFHDESRPRVGTAISFGINIGYIRSIYKGIYAKVAAGYLDQGFGIRRPFDYDVPFEPLYYTKIYRYQNIVAAAGVGYNKALNATFSFFGDVSYNQVHSFRQWYTPNFRPVRTVRRQIALKRMVLGSFISPSFGVEKSFSRKLSAGAAMISQVVVRWNLDETFFRFYNSDESQRIAHNKYSIGLNLLVKYHL